MTRRPKGTGSLFQRKDGRWVGLAVFLGRWFDEVAVHDVRAKSLANYRSLMRDYVIPDLGHLKLRDLRVDQVQTILNGIHRSPATIRHVRKVLGKALQHALVLGLVDRNVARLASIPKVEHAHNEPWNADDARRFLNVTRDEDRWPLYALALSTGARQGELLALRWEDVDLEAGRLRIQRGALHQIGPRQWEEQPTKTKSSRRTLRLEPLARSALVEQRQRHPSTGFVFCRADGRPLPGGMVTREFQAAARRAGLRVIRFHDLRHTCARLMLDNGADLRHVMAQLGHSSIATTNDIYGGYLEDSRAQASEIMGRVLAGVAER